MLNHLETVKRKMPDDRNTKIALGVLILLILGAGYYHYTVARDLAQTRQSLLETQNELENTEETLALVENDRDALSEAFYQEQQKNNIFEEQIKDLEDVVGDLDKLSRTDPELLQKYSKVFFLNEHYRPDDLKEIPKKWRIPEDDDEYIHGEFWPYLEDLLEDARDDGINLLIISAFRSFDEQRDLKSQYIVTYGAGTANQFSAEQGYSEHQLGTTVDFTTTELGLNYGAIDTTEAYKWLQDNAYKYGFVLSYPKGNQYYQYEPWHWRFVGKKLAKDLDRAGEYFYDWEQRKIDEYLIDLFD